VGDVRSGAGLGLYGQSYQALGSFEPLIGFLA